MSNSLRLPITQDDVERIERRIEELHAEAGAARIPAHRARAEYFIFTLETMLPVYKSFVRLLKAIEGNIKA